MTPQQRWRLLDEIQDKIDKINDNVPSLQEIACMKSGERYKAIEEYGELKALMWIRERLG